MMENETDQYVIGYNDGLLCDEFILGNIWIYIHFLSFLNTEWAKVYKKNSIKLGLFYPI